MIMQSIIRVCRHLQAIFSSVLQIVGLPVLTKVYYDDIICYFAFQAPFIHAKIQIQIFIMIQIIIIPTHIALVNRLLRWQHFQDVVCDIVVNILLVMAIKGVECHLTFYLPQPNILLDTASIGTYYRLHFVFGKNSLTLINTMS